VGLGASMDTDARGKVKCQKYKLLCGQKLFSGLSHEIRTVISEEKCRLYLGRRELGKLY
jgi:hypothetical protein